MNLVLRPRQSGKTTDLILKSRKTGSVIVCMSRKEVDRIYGIACNMDLIIPEPITYDQFLDKSTVSTRNIQSVLIDNCEYFLQYVCPCRVEAISMSTTITTE